MGGNQGFSEAVSLEDMANTQQAEETITISKKEYTKLLEDNKKLAELESDSCGCC